jgi:hypothetical protein
MELKPLIPLRHLVYNPACTTIILMHLFSFVWLLEVEIRRMKSMGLKGIKLHSEFQDFFPDDERMFDLYEALGRDMIVVFHAGDTCQ